ncbi:hypothetical protein FKW77_008880 [Venturia effusa]|uniref:Secreted protein n=1 Tax=Venturia effusa TaxID=50376 RepID=A0A517L014_9PEZI|nr:hypothetical protein FKW77_008880 [Venturia effusa]
MHFTSYLITTLLTVAPALVHANDCEHWQSIYVLKCDVPNKGPDPVPTACRNGTLEEHLPIFKKTRRNFMDFAYLNGGFCSGGCYDVVKKMKGRLGWTFQMTCLIPRANKKHIGKFKEPPQDLERLDDHKCDVNCMPAIGANQDCYVSFGRC